MKTIVWIMLLFAGSITLGFGQSPETLFQKLRRNPQIADFLYNNTDGSRIFWGIYDLNKNTLTPAKGGFSHPREILPEIEIIREAGIINVVILDNVIVYDKASIVTNNKSQTPAIIPSPGMNGWEERKLK